MPLYNLGAASWEDIQSIVGALAQIKREGAVLSRAQSPCVCAGGRVNLDHDVDSEFCRAQQIPMFRRETKSNVLCFAQMQIELQVVLARDNRLLSYQPAENCCKILTPILETCRALGLDAEYKEPSEIVVGGRRIASACVGQLRESVILAASLTLEFDADLFARVLNVRDPNMRQQIADLARARRTSLRQELGTVPPPAVLEDHVCRYLGGLVSNAEAAPVDPELKKQMRTSGSLFAPKRVQLHERMSNGWRVDMGAGTELLQCAYKAPGGFLRATCEWHDGRIAKTSLSGDFFCYPPGALLRLEQALVGVRADQVEKKLPELYSSLGLVTPGVHAAHWLKVLKPEIV